MKRSAAVAAVLTAAATTGVAVAATDSTTTTYGSGTPLVYHEVDPSRVSYTLGPQSNPTRLLVSPPMKAGWYQVSYSVALVVAKNDNVVCAASTAPGGNNGLFGTAGNSGGSPNYGTAAAVDTIQVKNGQQLSLTCDSNNNAGSSTGSVSMTAMKIGTLVKTTS